MTARPPMPGSEAWLRRFARQIVLREIGEAGQRRIGAATVRLVGRGDALVACAVHLASAGVGALELFDPSPLSASEAGRFPFAGARAGTPRDAALAAALVSRGAVARARAPTGPSGAADALVASCRAWTETFRAAGTGPVGMAEGALAADAILRRVARAGGEEEKTEPGAGAGAGRTEKKWHPVVAADGTVSRGAT